MKKIVQNNFIKEFYGDGSLKSVSEMSDGLKQGKMIEYYPNGNIKAQSNWINDTSTGHYIKYYESGNIESKASLYKGNLHGDFLQYDENGNLILTKNYYLNKLDGYEIIYEKASLFQMRHHISLCDSSYLNQIINFDKNGNIISNSSQYFSIFFPNVSDTIKLNESIEMVFYLSPAIIIEGRDIWQLHLGIFDEYDSPIEEHCLDTFFVNGYFKQLTLLFKKLGDQFIKGYILNPLIDKGSVIRYEKMYFTKHLHVVE